MDIQAFMLDKADKAKTAARNMAVISTELKNQALLAMADALEKRSELILSENAKDLEEGRQKGLKRSYLDRLMLDENRVSQMADGLRQTAALPDPIG